MIYRVTTQSFFFVLLLVISPLTNAKWYHYQDSNGYKFAVSAPLKNPQGMKLLEATDDSVSIPPLGGIASPTIEDIARLAAQGDADAQFVLGSLYYYGQGIEQDFKKAGDWYARAAMNGREDAANEVGHIYQYGQGEKIDYKKAVRWYTLAAKFGNADAQLNLGNAYFDGKGVIQDYKQAYAWYSIAAADGRKDAVDNRNSAESKLTPAALMEAQNTASELMQQINKNQYEKTVGKKKTAKK